MVPGDVKAAINSRVRQIIAEQLNAELHRMEGSDKLHDDLGGDSLDMIEMIMKLEEEFGIDMYKDNYDNVETVDDLVKFVIQYHAIHDAGVAAVKATVAPLNFRWAIQNRILEVVGTNDDLHGAMRWKALLSYAFTKLYGRQPDQKGDKKRLASITLRNIIDMTDADLFDTYEVVIRQFSKQF